VTIMARDVRIYQSQVMGSDDSATNIGGAINLAGQLVFTNVSGLVQAVSDSADTETIVIEYRDAGMVIQTESSALNGTTPVPFSGVVVRLLAVAKSNPTLGNIALEAQTATRTGTAQGGSADGITLDVGASSVDGFYRSQILRATGGTGAGQIRRIVQYDGATRVAWPSRPFGPAPDATTTFRVSRGVFLEVEPSECLGVIRLHYNAAADPVGGAGKDYYDKYFIKNLNPTESLLTAIVGENTDPEGQFDFALETAVNGSGTNTGTRLTPPVGGVTVFSGAAKPVPGVNLGSGDSIGVWSHLSLPAGDLSTDTSLAMQISGA
jgi:hypothetical protein